ncbi:MAG: serine/threonine protein kinase [Planctomycetota bacterium]|nr:serine/threonine protein kinase [Planctomycetota bacterium]
MSAPRTAQLNVPKRLGDFELLDKIGRGAMGSVYRARQTALDRVVAVKVLYPHVAENPQLIERFQREARASARLNHPHIVQGIAVGQDEASGFWYFAMEYVDGATLWEILHQTGPLEERRALELARDIAKALECAHKNGIVHRDIKPDNILITREGQPKLADLGLAKLLADEAAAATQSGVAVGTPHYMAPEQVAGETKRIDTRTDIYALGCTLYHLLTGRTPFEGKAATLIMTKQLNELPRPPHELRPGLSAGCSQLVLKMMQKRRSHRFQNPTELLEALERHLEGKPLEPPRAPVPAPAPEAGISGSRRPAAAPRSARARASRLRPVERLPRREPEFKPPNVWKGLLTDLAVLVVVLALLGGGLYYARSEGYLGFLNLAAPSETPPNPRRPSPRTRKPKRPPRRRPRPSSSPFPLQCAKLKKNRLETTAPG